MTWPENWRRGQLVEVRVHHNEPGWVDGVVIQSQPTSRRVRVKVDFGGMATVWVVDRAKDIRRRGP